MTRSRNVAPDSVVTNVTAIAGTSTVLLAWTMASSSAASGLRGFEIERTDEEGRRSWLGGFRRRSLLRTFEWMDYTVGEGRKYEYRVFARFADGDKDSRSSTAVTITTESNFDPSGSPHRHQMFANRGVAGSQAFQRRFPREPGEPLSADACRWLSNGLAESFLDIVNAAKLGDRLRGGFYEFSFKPALEALERARARGVDVLLVVDCTSKAKKSRIEEWPDGAERVDLQVWPERENDARAMGASCVSQRGEKKTWFVGRELIEEKRRALLRMFGPTGETLAMDKAMDECGGDLRDCVIRRTTCSGIPHNKFLVVNNTTVWTGSTNLTASGMYGQANVAHVVNDEAVAEKYLEYHAQLVKGAKTAELVKWNSDKDIPEVLAAGAEAGETTRVYFSPRGKKSPMLQRWAEMFGAAQSSACLTAAFTVNDLLVAECVKDTSARRYILKEKWAKKDREIEANVKNRVVRGAVLADGAADGFAGEALTGLNEHVKFIHWKTMLIDPMSESPTVITGSANFSKASVEINDENMLVIAGDRRIADMYFVEFFRLFTHFSYRDRVVRGGKKKQRDRWITDALTEGTREWCDRHIVLSAWI